MVTQSPAGIFTCNTNGVIINHNPAFLKILDIKESEIDQFNLFKQLSKEANKIYPLIEKIRQGESITSLPILCKTFNNQDKWLTLTLSQQQAPHDTSIEGQITDIHDRMSRQQEKEAHERQRMDSLQLLISGISHEINTPLGNNLTTLSFVDAIYIDLNNTCSES
jgi:PAS domain S-box-containing protein